jgi:hypothetical protein
LKGYLQGKIEGVLTRKEENEEEHEGGNIHLRVKVNT